MPSSERRLSTYLLLITMVVIWGVNFSLVKWALSELSPLAFNAVRFTLASGLIFVLLLLKEGWRPVPPVDMLKIFGLGLLGDSLFQVLFIEGIWRTTAGNSALFLSTTPLWTAALSVALGKERLSGAAWAGIGLATIGVILVAVGSSQAFSLGGPRTIGDLLVLLAALAWAGYSVFSKDLLRRYSPLRLTAMAMVTGSLGLWIFAIPAMLRQNWAAVSWRAWGAVAYSGALGIAVAYFIWAIGVQRLGPARTAIFSNLTPILAFIVAFLILGEPVTWLQGLGGVAILSGVGLTERS
ncbi:MAG: DMT family transporter [Candidatus Bipolaricaulia bacterium]